MKKRIGISFSSVKLQNYYGWFHRLGLANFVELIDLSFINQNIDDFKYCDGFILTGGDDIDPAFYGGSIIYANQPVHYHSQRDVFEKIIFEHAVAHHKPLLGICRGLQLINVIMGGELIQDLAGGNTFHQSENGHDKYHEVQVTANSLLSTICRVETGTTNSAHHQAVLPGRLGSNLLANAFSTDGCVEGLEFAEKKGLPFMLCVQWHPERMPDEQNPFSKNILNSFLEAISKTQPNQYADH